MRLLIVEDEPKTGAYLKKGLSEHGYAVEVARTGADGLHLALESDFELILLDVMLPGMNGWQVLAKLREKKETPVLFLTARDQVDDRVKGLEAGADDYLVKPFAFSELLARVRALLKRGKQAPVDTLSLADLEIDPIRRRVIRAGQRMELTAKEYALLLLFLRRQTEVLSRTFIAEQVWDMNFDSDTNVVDVAVRRLRAKVDDPFQQKLIHAVRGVGYVCEAR